MTGILGKSLGDVIGILVALWFLFSGDFSDMPYKRVLDAVALLVILLSVARIVLRLRGRS